MDLVAEARLQRLLVAGAAQGLLRSAHDCSEGGLLVAIAEAAIGGAYAEQGLGAECDLSSYAPGVTADSVLYGEDGARAIISCAPESVNRLAGLCREEGVPAFQAGTIGRPSGDLRMTIGDETLTWSVPALRKIYFEAIPRRMRQPDIDRSAGA